MDKKINKESIAEFLQYYRDIAVPIAVIVVCILLLIFFILPQLVNIANTRTQYSEVQNNIKSINNNISYLSSINEADMDKSLSIANAALPPNADFSAILNAIYSTAATSGVSVGNFQFNIGDIKSNNTLEALPTVELTLSVNGGVEEVQTFAQALAKILPLSDVKTVRVGGDQGSNMTIRFFYKPFTSTTNNGNISITPLSPNDQKLLDTLSSYNIAPSNTSSSATNSASVTPNFPF